MAFSAERPRGYPKFLEPILRDTSESTVVLYSRDNDDSKQVRSALAKQKLNFVDKNIDAISKTDAKAAKDYALALRVISQTQNIPQLFICGDRVGDVHDVEKNLTKLAEMVTACAKREKTAQARPDLVAL